MKDQGINEKYKSKKNSPTNINCESCFSNIDLHTVIFNVVCALEDLIYRTLRK